MYGCLTSSVLLRDVSYKSWVFSDMATGVYLVGMPGRAKRNSAVLALDCDVLVFGFCIGRSIHVGKSMSDHGCVFPTYCTNMLSGVGTV
jgi:hypothetical protein